MSSFETRKIGRIVEWFNEWNKEWWRWEDKGSWWQQRTKPAPPMLYKKLPKIQDLRSPGSMSLIATKPLCVHKFVVSGNPNGSISNFFTSIWASGSSSRFSASSSSMALLNMLPTSKATHKAWGILRFWIIVYWTQVHMRASHTQLWAVSFSSFLDR